MAGTCSGEYCVGKESVSEIEKKYQELLETLSPEQEEVITEYCNAIFSSGADTEEFFYRLGLKDGLNLKNTVKSVLEIETEADPHTIEVHIGRIRERFKDNPDFEIVTMRGIGYKVVKK